MIAVALEERFESSSPESTAIYIYFTTKRVWVGGCKRLKYWDLVGVFEGLAEGAAGGRAGGAISITEKRKSAFARHPGFSIREVQRLGLRSAQSKLCFRSSWA